MQVIRHGVDVSANYGPDELEAIKLGYEAFDGEVGQGSIPIPDAAGDQESYAGESLKLVDGAVTIFDGWVGNQDRARGAGAVPPRRLVSHTLGDENACLQGHATAGWTRAAELPHERWAAFLDDFVDPALGTPLDRTWLLSTNEGGATLKKKVYRTDDLFNELFTDTQEKTGKTVFVVDREFHWHLAVEGEVLDVAISDTTFDHDAGWPPLAPTVLRSKDQMDLRTHIWGRNSKGVVVEASDATAIGRHDADGLVHHGFMEFSDETEAQMQSAVNIALAESRKERITYECDLGPMDAAHVARFKPGGLLNCTSQVWGLSSSTQRIARRDVSYIHPGLYKLHLELGYPIRKRRKTARTVNPVDDQNAVITAENGGIELGEAIVAAGIFRRSIVPEQGTDSGWIGAGTSRVAGSWNAANVEWPIAPCDIGLGAFTTVEIRGLLFTYAIPADTAYIGGFAGLAFTQMGTPAGFGHEYEGAFNTGTPHAKTGPYSVMAGAAGALPANLQDQLVLIANASGTPNGQLYVPKNALPFGANLAIVIWPGFVAKMGIWCDWAACVDECGSINVTAPTLKLATLAAGAYGWLEASPVGAQDGSNMTFTLPGGYSRVDAVWINDERTGQVGFSATDGSTITLQGRAPKATDLLMARYYVPK